MNDLKKLIRADEVIAQVGFCKSWLYQQIALNQFPAPIKIGGRAVAWDQDEVQLWIEEKLAAGKAKTQGNCQPTEERTEAVA